MSAEADETRRGVTELEREEAVSVQREVRLTLLNQGFDGFTGNDPIVPKVAAHIWVHAERMQRIDVAGFERPQSQAFGRQHNRHRSMGEAPAPRVLLHRPLPDGSRVCHSRIHKRISPALSRGLLRCVSRSGPIRLNRGKTCYPSRNTWNAPDGMACGTPITSCRIRRIRARRGRKRG